MSDDNEEDVEFDYIQFDPDQDDPEDKGETWFVMQGLIGFMDFLQEGKEVFLMALLFPLHLGKKVYKWWHRN